uniref:Uncharacterized protein n=1 Tax=Avena sativa TaxID=4498 RepID=A0ACD5Y819_AVESA
MSIGVLATNYWRAKKKPVERKTETWKCPTEGVIKINVDAAYDEDLGKGAMRVIARDFTGKFIAASCKELHFVTDAMMAEAYALREGLSLAQLLGGNKFIIQSDNALVIETIEAGGFSATSSAAIFDDCRILSSGFREILFEKCQRKANGVAHELARHSFLTHSDCIWDDEPPSFLLPSIINDVTLV